MNTELCAFNSMCTYVYEKHFGLLHCLIKYLHGQLLS